MRYVHNSAIPACLSYKTSLVSYMPQDIQYFLGVAQQFQRYLRELLSSLHANGAINFVLYVDTYATSVNIPVLTLTSLLLAEITLIFLLGYHSVLGLMYFRVKGKLMLKGSFKPRSALFNGGDKYLLTVVIPIKSEPIDLVVKTVRDGLKSLREVSGVEILIVSDDSEEYVRELSSKLPYRNVRVVRRERNEGGRSAALDFGFRLAKGTYVMYVDADARIGPEMAKKILESLGRSDVIVIPWRGYYGKRTKLGEAFACLTTLYSFLYHTLRSALNLFVFPLGSGTIYRKEVLESINGWGPGIVQDDIWLGTKLAVKGVEPEVLNGCYLDVLVPSKYTAFRIQQCRWAYGTSEVLSRMFWRILRAPLSAPKKLEMIVYMLQPAVSIPILASILLATAAAVVDGHLGIMALLHSPIAVGLGAAVITLSILYSVMEICIARDLGYGPTWRISCMLGRQAAFHASLIPLLAVYSMLGFLRKKLPYRITPKGSHEDMLGIDTPLLIMTVVIAALFAICAISLNLVAAVMVFAFLVPYIYTIINFNK